MLMKVLLVCNPKTTGNPFVVTLCDELNRQGCYATMSSEELWSAKDYDVIHFQWPEAVFDWTMTVSQNQVEKLTKKLDCLKSEGKKIVITCHNLKPHTRKDKGVLSLYGIIYNRCDMFIHLGSYSKELLEKQYPEAKHIIIPHHIYDTLYQFNLDKKACQRELNINSDNFNVLCFGKFRNDEERNMLIRLYKRCKQKQINFITPGFYKMNWISRNVFNIPGIIAKHICYKLLGFRYKNRSLSDEELVKYFTASDAVLIQRLSILNSGNLPMGYFAGKVVVGPNVGNVGRILSETGNPTFDPQSMESIYQKLLEARRLSMTSKGIENRRLALKKWKTECIAKELIDAYQSIVIN